MKILLFILGLSLSYAFPTLGGFQIVNVQQAQTSSQIQTFIQAGLQQILQEGAQKGEFKSTDFVLSKILSVSKQISSQENYKISCEFKNDQDISLLASFEVTQSSQKKIVVTSSSYEVKEISLVQQVENTYVQVSSAEVQYSSEIQKVITFGVDEVIKRSVSAGTIPDLNYEVSQVVSVYRQIIETALFYKCDVDISDNSGVTIETIFTVYYQPLQDTSSLVDYSCNVQSQEHENVEVAVTANIVGPDESQYTPLPVKQVQDDSLVKDVVDYGCNQINEIAIQEKKIPSTTLQVKDIEEAFSQIVGNGVFYKFTCILTNYQAVSVQATFTIYYDVYTKQKKLTAYSYESQSAQTNMNTEFNQEISSSFNQEELYQEQVLSFQENNIGQPIPWQPQQDVEVVIVPPEQEGQGELPFIPPQGQEGPPQGQVGPPQGQVGPPQGQEGPPQGQEGLPQPWQTEAENIILYEGQNLFPNQPQPTETVVNEQTFPIQGQLPLEEAVPQIEVNDITETIIIPDFEQGLNTGQTQSGGGQGSIFDVTFPLPEEQASSIQQPPEVEVETTEAGPQPPPWPDQANAPLPNGNQNVPPPRPDQGPTTEQQFEEQEFYEESSLTVADIEQNSEVQSIFQFGVNSIIENGIETSQISSDTNFKVSTITSGSERVGDFGSLYKFSCEAADQQGTAIEMSFTVYFDYSSHRKTLASYWYNVKSLAPTTFATPVISLQGNYVPCTQEEIQSDAVQNALNFGAAQIYFLGLQEGKIPSSEFSISQVISVSKQETVSGIFYQCQVVLVNSENLMIDASFTILHQYSTDQDLLSSYSYTIRQVESKASTEETTETQTDNSYTELSSNEINSSSQIQNVLTYGVNQIIEKGYSSGKIPDSNYQISRIVSVKRKVETGGRTLYDCSVEMAGANEAFITAEFIISMRSESDLRLMSWSYDISNIKTTTTKQVNTVSAVFTEVDKSEVQYSPEIQSCLQYGIEQTLPDYQQYTVSNIQSVSRQIVESALYYKFEVELSSNSDKAAQLDCTVYYKPDVNIKDVTSFSYKIKTTRTTTSTTSESRRKTKKYQRIDVSDIKSDSTYQSILDYGAQQCVQDLYNYKIIASTDFQVVDILSAFSQKEKHVENLNLAVKLGNSIGIFLNVNFNVRYEKKTESKTLTSYSVEGSTAGQSDVLVADYNAENGDQLQVGNCDKVIQAEVDSNNEVKQAIDYGVDQVVKNVVENEDISDSDFTIKQVNNVYREQVDLQNYFVQATLSNSKNTNIDCSFSVNYQSSSNTKELLSYSYIIY